MAKKEKVKQEEVKKVSAQVEGIAPRLIQKYKDEVIKSLMTEFKYKNIMQVPKLEKIAINIGVGRATQDQKLLETAVSEIELITGQKALITKSKKSISNFKLRENQPIGAKITLRGKKMFEFFDRLVSVAMPQIRDFRGISDRSFDGNGNYTLGIKEQIIFREIDADKVTNLTGMDVTFVTSAKTDNEAMALLKAFGVPFIKR